MSVIYRLLTTKIQVNLISSLAPEQKSEISDNSVKECTVDNMDKIWDTAKIIRNELLKREKWKFTGSFDDFSLPPLLSTLVKWILIGRFLDFQI